MCYTVRAAAPKKIVGIVAFVALSAFVLAGYASAQSTASPATSTSTASGGTGGHGSGGAVGIGIDVGSLFGGSRGKGPCDEILDKAQAARDALRKKDCSKAEAEVAAAQENLKKAMQEVGEDRVRRDALAADARAAAAASHAEDAKLAAAQAQLAAAQQALAAANAAVTQALQSYFQVSGNWYQASQPATGQWIGIDVGGGLTIYMQDDYGAGFWTPNRIAIMRAKIQSVLSGGKGAAALNALHAAQAQLQAAQAALAAAQAAAAAAAKAYEAADQAIHGLPPVDAPKVEAERRLEAALAALEKCREEMKELADKLAALEAEAEECHHREMLNSAAAGAKADSDRAAAEAKRELEQAKEDAKDLARSAGNGTGTAENDARNAAASTGQDAAAAEAKLKADQAAAARAEAERKSAQTTAEAQQAADDATAARKALLDDADNARKIKETAEQAQANLDAARAQAQAARERAEQDAARIAQNAVRAAQKQQDMQDLKSDMDDLAGQMAEGTAKDMLGTASEMLASMFKAIEGYQTIADLPANRLLFLRRLSTFLGAVLRGNEVECWAAGDGVVDAAAGLSGSDQLRGAAYMGHFGYPLCQAFLRAAENPANRAVIEKMHDALKRLVGGD